MGQFVLALDIGGTHTRVALYSSPESLRASRCERFPTINTYNGFLQHMRLLRKWLPESLVAGGISFGVEFTSDGRSVLTTSKLPDYAGKPLVSDLESILECPCRAAHDCVCGAVAENSSLKDGHSLAYVTFSTGTGAAVCMQSGAGLFSFRVRLAHHVIDRDGPKCKCGQRGCLGVFTDGIRLTHLAGGPLETVKDPSFWQPVVDAFALGLVNLSWMFPVNKIIVGGSIALKNDTVRKMLPPAFAKTRSTGLHRQCAFAFAKLGENAPLLGARLLPSLHDLNVIY